MNASFDDTACRMLTLPEAAVSISLADQRRSQDLGQGLPVIERIGNGRGMASLGSILLWLFENTWRQEFLSLTALPFIKRHGLIAVSLRVSHEDGEGNLGRVRLLDPQSQFEWEIPQDDLPLLAQGFYRLTSETPLHSHYPDPRADGSLVGDAEIFAGGTGEW